MNRRKAKFFVTGLAAFLVWGLTYGPCSAAGIVARGSDSTINVVKALVKAFGEDGGAAIKVEGGGSSKGAAACIAGDVNLAFMSRGPKSKETSAGLVAVPYAIDGVAIIVNPKNPTSDISKASLKEIFIGKKTKWENGKPVMALNRPATSGTREVFQGKVLGKGVAFGPKVAVKHDKAAHMTVAKVVTAVAYTSAGALKEGENLKVLTVDGVNPEPKTLRDGSYPIARTLHFGTKGEASGDIKAFLDFVKSGKGQAVIQQEGFVTLK